MGAIGIIKNNCRRIRDLYHWLKMFRQRRDCYFIKNKNIIEKQCEDETYRKFLKKYGETIRLGIEADTPPQKNDIVWILWLQGIEEAPPLVQACIASVRKNMKGKRIIILTEDIIQQYVNLPDFVYLKRKQGIISNAHFSDLVRVSLLCDHGGIWCDATVLLTETPPSFMTDDPLFVFKSMDLARYDLNPTVCSSWYISSWSNQRILLLTRKLLLDYWKTEDKIDNYYIFHIFLAMAARRYPDDWNRIPFFNNHSPHTLQFELNDQYTQERWQQILNMSPIHKLNHHIEYLKSGTFYGRILDE